MYFGLTFLTCKFEKEKKIFKKETCDKAIEVIENFFELLYSRYPIRLETSMKNSDFIFDYVDLLYYKCHKIDSYIIWYKID